MSPFALAEQENSVEVAPVEARALGSDESATRAQLLHELKVVADNTHPHSAVVDVQTDQLLVSRRLGTAAGLFIALRWKHSPTARHALLVALTCSAWARQLGIGTDERETIEIAALLHDLWIMGVPDSILQKPGPLAAEESQALWHCRRCGGDILRASGADASLVNMVECTPVWYCKSMAEGGQENSELPRGARMIAIAEAFHSLTTDRIFRPACSKEQALAELVRCAGTQFDPDLVERFVDVAMRDQSQLHRELANQWLRDLPASPGHALWCHDWALPQANNMHVAAYFQAKILDNTRDCVVLVDPVMNIIGWNRRVEQLTGILAESIIERRWTPEILELRDFEDRLNDRAQFCDSRFWAKPLLRSLPFVCFAFAGNDARSS